MIEEYELIDSSFTLDWSKDPKRFKFYAEKFIPSSGLSYFTMSIKIMLVFALSEYIVLFILKNTLSFNQESYLIFEKFFVYGGLLILSLLTIVSFIWFLVELVLVKPRFRINKQSRVYITDGDGIYIVDYSVGNKSNSINYSKYFPIIVEKIVKNSNSLGMKFDSRFFTNVVYLDSYNIVSKSSEYIMLDVPSDSSIYDDLNDFEIPSRVKGFKELSKYIEDTEGGYYLD